MKIELNRNELSIVLGLLDDLRDNIDETLVDDIDAAMRRVTSDTDVAAATATAVAAAQQYAAIMTLYARLNAAYETMNADNE